MQDLVYILSPSYSGSTLLTLLMAMHSDITTIGELKGTAMGSLDEYTCSCGEPIKACDFWQTLSQKILGFRLENFGTHFTSNNPLYDRVLRAQVRAPWFESARSLALKWPPLANRYRAIHQRNKLFMHEACILQGGSWFLDGSKDPHRLRYLKDSGHYRIKVIEMVRDGRAQSHSQRKKNYHGGDFSKACEEWRYTIEQMQHVLTRFDESDVLSVTYESLCQAPSLVMNAIWDFLSLPALDQDWRSVNLRQTPHHIIGNNMRTKSDISIRVDNGWLDDLSKKDHEIFKRVAGDTHHQLGYSF